MKKIIKEKFAVYFALFLALIIAACMPTKDTQERADYERKNYLPFAATNAKPVGNGWYTFEFEGNKFLFYRYSIDQMCIARIEER